MTETARPKKKPASPGPERGATGRRGATGKTGASGTTGKRGLTGADGPRSAIDTLIETDQKLIQRFDTFITWLKRILAASVATAIVCIALMCVNVYFVVDNNNVGKNAEQSVELIKGALATTGGQADRARRGTADAQVDIDCRNRRALVHLPAPPDDLIPCKDQTPPSVYPG